MALAPGDGRTPAPAVPAPAAAEGTAPTGAEPAEMPVGPARDPPPGARTVPSPEAQATRSPNSATATATASPSPMTARRPGSHRAATRDAGSRNHVLGCRGCASYGACGAGSGWGGTPADGVRSRTVGTYPRRGACRRAAARGESGSLR